MANYQDEFIDLYRKHIRRPGSEELLQYLLSDQSDFFTAPASTRFHLSHEGGLVEHSLNVYHCLRDYLGRERVTDEYKCQPSEESVAIVGLLHDLCKVNVYRKSFRNVKDANGKWNQVPSFDYRDDLPYGHGEKSVYIISGFMRLTREEAFAIRYHMGFSADMENKADVSRSFELFPLALCLSIADMEATFFLESSEE
ncbi:MAG TPA: HD domain-containing protein [Bacillota bacterium]|nr:HD domain-containing protein [Bacillota bacterium]HPF42290.1 HD domain-containing protein [Bacillota bacterium]HPJ86124.1 HD domain-containing protein [Bacillota bacterium]HPQ61942.1 HD domain-containing protein [Bacillota bacterium]HRX91958.1 HD domain-containing protein [Candidatus Izemoplasmatales bacterium]